MKDRALPLHIASYGELRRLSKWHVKCCRTCCAIVGQVCTFVERHDMGFAIEAHELLSAQRSRNYLRRRQKGTCGTEEPKTMATRQIKPNFLATSSRQHAKKGIQKGPKKQPRTPPDAPNRFKGAIERCLGTGQPRKADF